MLKQGFLKVYARYSYLENRVQTHSKEPTQMHRIEASTLGPSLVFYAFTRPATDGLASYYDFNMRRLREL